MIIKKCEAGLSHGRLAPGYSSRIDGQKSSAPGLVHLAENSGDDARTRKEAASRICRTGRGLFRAIRTLRPVRPQEPASNAWSETGRRPLAGPLASLS